MRRSLASLVALTASSSLFAAAPSKPSGSPSAVPSAKASPNVISLETGEISGAKFTLARPSRWNRRLILLAHGFRGEDRPLIADLLPEQLAYRTYLQEGWMVATTSFRRNGVIIGDAISDLDALRAHIEQTYGPPERVLLEGESMGGLIVTLMAEREYPDRPRYSGAVAVGAALDMKEPNPTLGLSLQPRIPLLFLTNRSEFEGPRNYVETKFPRDQLSVRPALFRISRDGHVNVNQRERLAALRALNAWLDRGVSALPRPAEGGAFFDATVAPEPQPSQVTLHPDDRGFDAHVTEVSASYGNVIINAQPADFTAAGIGKGSRFQLTAHGQNFRVIYGRDFESVKRGEWVVFASADGFFVLARNWADAAASAHLTAGDPVTLRRYDDSK